MEKQTGPAWAVKGLAVITAFAALTGLAGCNATEWSNPKKTAAETRADTSACNKLGEEDALERSGRPRADSGPPGGPRPGLQGTSPMEMHDQRAAAHDFHSSFDTCMESKGYTR